MILLGIIYSSGCQRDRCLSICVLSQRFDLIDILFFLFFCFFFFCGVALTKLSTKAFMQIEHFV